MLQQKRDEILKMFKKAAFPKDKVMKDCLPHSDIIFNENSEDNVLKPGKVIISKEFFTFENEEKKTKFQKENFSESNQPSAQMNWRTIRNDNTPSTNINNNKQKEGKQGNLNNNKPKTRPKNEGKAKDGKLDSQYNSEPVSEQNRKELEEQTSETTKGTGFNPNEGKPNPLSQISPNAGMNQNQFFNIMQQQSAMLQHFMLPSMMMHGDPYFDPAFDIKILEKYNKKLQFPDNLPLWYLFHPMIKSSYGPLTTLQVESMFNSKLIFSNSLIRFIDIYERKNHDQFNFFPIKELENENLLNEIVPSKILKYLYIENLNNLNSNSNATTDRKNSEKSNIEIISVQTPSIKESEETLKKEEDFEEILQPSNDQQGSNQKKGKKKKHRPNYEDYNPSKHNKNYNPSINSYNTNPSTNTFVNIEESENWEQVGKPKRQEKNSNKLVGTRNAPANNYNSNNYNSYSNQTNETQGNANVNPNQNQNPKRNSVKQNQQKQVNQNINDGSKLLDSLNPLKKLDPSIEIIETDYIPHLGQKGNQGQAGQGKKAKKGGKAKFTDLNVEIGMILPKIGTENIGGDIYKVESKKKK